MPTLHDTFAELAEEAPDSPTPEGIWVDGRRRARVRRVGTGVVVAVTVVLLSAVGGWAVHRDRAPDAVGDPDAVPGIPTQIHHPSPWLPGTDGTPPGQLSTL